jgi:O-antigen ligase
MNQIKNRPIFLIEILYLLIPIALVFSIAVSELFLNIIVIFFIIYSLKYKIFYYYKNRFFICFIFFCTYLILVSLIKNNGVPISVLFFFRFGLFALSTWFLLDNNKNLIKMILISIFITYSIVIADAIFQYFFGVNLLGAEYNISEQPRLSGFFEDELILGSYLSRLSPLIFLQLGIFMSDIRNNFSPKILIICVFLFFFSTVIFASGERLSFIYFFMSSMFFLFFLKSIKRSFFVLVTFVFAFLFISIGSESRLIKTTVIQIQDSFINSDTEKFKLKDFNKLPIIHLHHWKTSVLMAKENIFFGVGPRMFRVECKNPKYAVPNGCATHPHSIYFQLLGETGIIGFILIFFFFFYILIKIVINYQKNISFKLENKKTLAYFSLCCLFLHFFPFLPNGNFFNNWLNTITFIPMGIFLYSNDSNSRHD